MQIEYDSETKSFSVPCDSESDHNADWTVALPASLGVNQMVQITEGNTIFSLIDELFPDSKLRSNFKIITDFAVDKLTWMHTLQHKYSQIKEIQDMLDNRTRRRGRRGGKRMQKKKDKPAGSISKAQKLRLRKQRTEKNIFHERIYQSCSENDYIG